MKGINVVWILILFWTLASCSPKDKPTQYKSIDEKTLSLLEKDLEKLQNDTTSNNDTLIQKANKIASTYNSFAPDVYEKIAHTFYTKSNLHLAKLFFEKSAEAFKNKGEQLKYAEELTNIGVLNELLGDYPAAIKQYNEALLIFKSLNKELKSSFIYNNLGIVYQQIGNENESIKYYRKSIKICDSLERLDLNVSRYNNIASAFEEFNHDLDSALYFYTKAFQIIKKDTNNAQRVIIESNIANIYIQKGELEKADSLLAQASLDIERMGRTQYKNTINKFKSELLLKKEDYTAAEKEIRKTIALAQKQNKKEDELESLLLLKTALEKQGEFKEALVIYEQYNQLKSEIAGIERQKEIENLNIRYNVQQKDSKIKLLEIQKEIFNRRAYFLSAITLILFLLLIAILYNVNLKKKHTALLIKQMQRDITDYINQIHDFEEKIHEKEVSQHDLFLQKIKQFGLTEREEEVLLYISKGYKNTEIAEKMFVSVNTVKTHIKNIFVKLDVRNRIEAANKAKV